MRYILLKHPRVYFVFVARAMMLREIVPENANFAPTVKLFWQP